MKYIIFILCFISYLYFLNIDSKAQNGGQMRSTFPVDNGKEIATLAGGCFWCLEALFLELRGVEKVESGYSGGNVPNPSYDQVCTGTTGHAEVVQI
ncbi:MAG: peptide-methionine (S)-S-oxide reductase, partial [Candidatus Jettenia caeni]|nr:peptide-methionine (S)-S-oxide reductase [Candidatus Jettenia caeni]